MRILFCLGMILCALFLPFWIFVVLILLYTLLYNGYELIPISLAIDALFGEPGRGVWCMYTLATLSIVVIMVLIKPHLRFYSE